MGEGEEWGTRQGGGWFVYPFCLFVCFIRALFVFFRVGDLRLELMIFHYPFIYISPWMEYMSSIGIPKHSGIISEWEMVHMRDVRHNNE